MTVRERSCHLNRHKRTFVSVKTICPCRVVQDWCLPACLSVCLVLSLTVPLIPQDRLFGHPLVGSRPSHHTEPRACTFLSSNTLLLVDNFMHLSSSSSASSHMILPALDHFYLSRKVHENTSLFHLSLEASLSLSHRDRFTYKPSNLHPAPKTYRVRSSHLTRHRSRGQLHRILMSHLP